jgi:hypothetical protein
MKRPYPSPRQQQVLDIVSELGGILERSPANYRLIARRIGWRRSDAVGDCLFALRAKGLVESRGPSTRPTLWIVRRPS